MQIWIIDCCDFEIVDCPFQSKCSYVLILLSYKLDVLLKIININEIESRQINGTALYDVELNEINFDRVGLVANVEDKTRSSPINGSVISFEKCMCNAK